MVDELRERPGGLVTDPSEASQPSGSLSDARNVVVRRRGVVSPRPGLPPKTLGYTPSTDAHPTAFFDYGGDTLVWDSSNLEWFWLSDGTLAQYTDPGGTLVDPEPLRTDLMGAAEARGNLYVTSEIGLVKATSATGSFDLSGAPVVTSCSVSAVSGSLVPDGEFVAYRVVVRRTDDNGVIVRGRPGGRVVYNNTSGATRDPRVIAYLHANMDYSGTVLELYRTKVSTVTPDEEYSLVTEHQVTASDISGQAVSFGDDGLDDSDRGASLYTSPSREGELRQNDRPPSAGAVALYRGSVFLANTVDRQRFTLQFQDESNGGPNYYDVSSVTRTNGSDVLTTSSSVSDLEVGMLINGTGFASGTYVLDITTGTPNQIQVSTSCTDGGGTGSIRFYDTVEISDGTSTERVLSYTMALGSTPIPSISYLTTGRGFSGAFESSLVYAVTERLDGDAGGEGHLVNIYELQPGGGTLSIRATHPEKYENPDLEDMDTGSAIDFTQNAYPNRIAWSKQDEPEHFAPVNYAFVGSAKKEILALASTQDALWILKEDGVFRLTGSSEKSGWRIDPFDADTLCISPKSVKVLDDAVYFLSNKGIVRLTSAGVQELSDPVIGNLFGPERMDWYNISTVGIFRGIYNYFSSNSQYQPGSVALVNPIEREYIISLADESDPGHGEYFNRMLVFNAKTGAWTYWTITEAGFGLHWDTNNQTVLVGVVDGVREERTSTSTLDGDRVRWLFDDTDTFSGATTSGSTLTVSSTSGYGAGDTVLFSGDDLSDLYQIVSVDSGTQVTLDREITGSPVAGTVYKVYDAWVEWARLDGGDPTQLKHWREVTHEFERAQGLLRITHTFRSDYDYDQTTETHDLRENGLFAERLGLATRALVPRPARRSRVLKVGFQIHTAFAVWDYTAVRATFTASGRAGVPLR